MLPDEASQRSMTDFKRAITPWRLRTRALELGRRTLVMGIVNITPDSFSDGGTFLDPEAAVAHALELLDKGADLLDLGAESTRPGSRAGGTAGSALAPTVSAGLEQARLLPVLEALLKARPHAVVSVDTYKAATARAALTAGAEIVNDVSGFKWDAEMAAVCAEAGCGVVLMHALRNALIPIITVIGLEFGAYLTGSILTETIFSWPGVGRYVLTAIDKRDLPAIQGSILFLSLVFVIANLVTDLCYAAADPRVAYD